MGQLDFGAQVEAAVVRAFGRFDWSDLAQT
jgi:hypothetical protein